MVVRPFRTGRQPWTVIVMNANLLPVLLVVALLFAGCLDSFSSVPSTPDETDGLPTQDDAPETQRRDGVTVRLDPQGHATLVQGETLKLRATATDRQGQEIMDAEFRWSTMQGPCTGWLRPQLGDSARAEFQGGLEVGNRCLVTVTETSSGAAADLVIEILARLTGSVVVEAAAEFIWANDTLEFTAKAFDPEGEERQDATFHWEVAPSVCGTINVDPKDGGKAVLHSGSIAPLNCTVTATTWGDEVSAQMDLEVRPASFAPHVIVGIPDTGINPYHEQFHRPGLTIHPCEYIRDFPCDIPKLDLSIGVYDNYLDAYEADRATWMSVKEGDWYWIPETVFVAVYCESPYSSNTFQSDHCILDDNGHGTGTASSVLTENPDALIAASEARGRISHFEDKQIPVDIYSVSWGNIAPIPGHPEVLCVNHATAPIYVVSSGNDPRSTLIDCWTGDPNQISVGGAYAEDNTEEGLAAKQPEVVSYFCRPTALHESITEWRSSYCGTSFAAPTVAGALSKVVLAIREASGYTGGLQGDFVDPVAGVTIADLRDAMNRTASYNPEPQYSNTLIGVPLNPVAPWVQWGWGFYDGRVAETTIEDLLGVQAAPGKPAQAQAYMEAMHTVKTTLYGPLPAP